MPTGRWTNAWCGRDPREVMPSMFLRWLEPSDAGPSVRPTRWLLLGSMATILLLGSVQVARRGFDLPDGVVVLAALALFGSAMADAWASGRQAERRRSETESFARILQALSRSVSAESVVHAIVRELAAATAADHVAVARLPPHGEVMEVTLVSMSPDTPTASVRIPLAALEHPLLPLVEPAAPPAEGKRRREPAAGTAFPAGLAERVALELRAMYALHNTLAAGLQGSDGPAGAIVLSRRTEEPWPDAASRLLESAARETSAALDRIYSHHTAQVQAHTDALTGLPNRRYFDEFASLVATRRRATDRIAVLAIDVDHFKRLNDVHGHPVGDQVLSAIGAAIQASVREEDVPARYGGEEFMVLLRNPGPGIAMEVGERIRVAVRELELHQFGVGRVTVSVGVASGRDAGEPVPSILDRADRALYAAKGSGRDRVVESRLTAAPLEAVEA